MKRILLSSAVVLALTVTGGAAYKAAADTGSPTPDMSQPPAPPGPPGPPGQWGGGPERGQWGPGGPGRFWVQGWGQGGHGFQHNDKFGLFAPEPNKNLSIADVKVIASAILLEHGNHAWGVSDIAAQTDKSIQFSFTTQHGDVVATFSVDPASGHIKRIS